MDLRLDECQGTYAIDPNAVNKRPENAKWKGMFRGRSGYAGVPMMGVGWRIGAEPCFRSMDTEPHDDSKVLLRFVSQWRYFEFVGLALADRDLGRVASYGVVIRRRCHENPGRRLTLMNGRKNLRYIGRC